MSSPYPYTPALGAFAPPEADTDPTKTTQRSSQSSGLLEDASDARLAPQPRHAAATGQPPDQPPPQIYQPQYKQPQMSVLGQLAQHGKPGGLLSLIGAGAVNDYNNAIHQNELEHRKYEDSLEAARFAHQKDSTVVGMDSVDDQGRRVTRFVRPTDGMTVPRYTPLHARTVQGVDENGNTTWNVVDQNTGDSTDTGVGAVPRHKSDTDMAYADYLKHYPDGDRFDFARKMAAARQEGIQSEKPDARPKHNWVNVERTGPDGKKVYGMMDQSADTPTFVPDNGAQSVRKVGTQAEKPAPGSREQLQKMRSDAILAAGKAGKLSNPDTAQGVIQGINQGMGGAAIGIKGPGVGLAPDQAAPAQAPSAPVRSNAVDTATFTKNWAAKRPGQPLTPAILADAKSKGYITD